MRTLLVAKHPPQFFDEIADYFVEIRWILVAFSTPGILLVIVTVTGFIRHLPHDLVEAFHATLEEVAQADLLLHVVDAHDANRQANISQVNEVLKTIGAEEVPQVLIYNKIDLCEGLPVGIERDENRKIRRIFVSAQENQGVTDLQLAVTELLETDIVKHSLVLKPKEGKLRAQLYRLNAVQSEKIDDDGNYHLIVKMPRIEWERYRSGISS